MKWKGEVVNLAEYRAQRAVLRASDTDTGLVEVHRGPRGLSLGQASHRRRMLQHLATLATSGPKAASES